MALYDLWKSNPDQIREKRVDQIIGFAGDGKLGDKNTAPEEFRDFLSRIPGETLDRYAQECLQKSFTDSGLALQDIVNEIANRIGFSIEYGRYRGTQNDIGHDGIWTGPEGNQIVAEVKTSDAYRMPIETVASYRRRLIKSGKISEDESSILIIVGREDTGELEAQIRGSRHSWDVRIISVDAIIRLMLLRQDIDDPIVETQIRSLLIPREYTRVDEIIDLMFSTTEDLTDEPSLNEQIENNNNHESTEPRDKPVSFNAAVAAKLSLHLDAELTKQSRIIFADKDKDITTVCAVSKEYSDSKTVGYWFAFHPHQLEKLEAASIGFAAFGCGSDKQIALFPVQFIKKQLNGMNQTIRDDGRSYWHVQIFREADSWILRRRKDQDQPIITNMMLLTD